MSTAEVLASPSALPRPKRKREDVGQDDRPRTKRQPIERPQQAQHDEAVSHMDRAILSDHLAKALKRHSGDSTSIELEEKFIPSAAIRDTSEFTSVRVAQNLPQYLETFAKDGKNSLSSSETTSSPHTIIITASGIRAADVHRSVRCFGNKDSKIAKLFAKHMKLKESVEFVTKNKIGIAVGTPSRLKELVDQDALKTGSLQRIVIDASYVDEKKRTIFDMKEIFIPMMELLNSDKVKPRYGAHERAVEILVF